MPIKDLPKGIEYCLANGKRLYDDAVLLHKQKRLRTAIPIYILAYEEFGKAVFLFGKHSDAIELDEKEYTALSSFGSHSNKILMDYAEVEDRLMKMTDESFRVMQAWAQRTGQNWWSVDRKTAIAINKKSMETLKKLNSVKKKFLYVDYKHSQWQMSSQFSDKMLGYLCDYLNSDVLRPFYIIKVDMYMLSLGANKGTRLTPGLEKALLESRHRKNLNDLFTVFKSVKWKKTIQNAYQVIASIEASS